MKKLLTLLFILLMANTANAAKSVTLRDGSGNELGTSTNPIQATLKGDGTSEISLSDSTRIDNANNSTEYIDFNDFPGDNMTTISPGLEIKEANVIFARIGDDIETLIGNASAGDTIYLATGTYTITGANTITVAKAINLVGHGRGQTIIAASGAAFDVFEIQADGFSIRDLTFDLTIGTNSTVSRAIYVNAQSSTVFTNIKIENVEVNMNGAGLQRAIMVVDSYVDLLNCFIKPISTNDDAVGLFLNAVSTAEAAMTHNIVNSVIVTDTAGSSGTDESLGVNVAESAATQNLNVKIYNTTIVSTEQNSGATSTALNTSGNNALVITYNSLFKGDDADTATASSSSITDNYQPN